MTNQGSKAVVRSALSEQFAAISDAVFGNVAETIIRRNAQTMPAAVVDTAAALARQLTVGPSLRPA